MTERLKTESLALVETTSLCVLEKDRVLCYSKQTDSVHFTVYFVNCTFYILQFTVYSLTVKFYTLQFTVYSLQFTIYSVHCTMFSVHWTVLIVQYTVYVVQCALYSVQCKVYSVLCTDYIIQKGRVLSYSKHTSSCVLTGPLCVLSIVHLTEYTKEYTF